MKLLIVLLFSISAQAQYRPGAVTSNAPNERLEHAKISWSAGTPSITTQSGGTLKPWLSSVTDNNTGDVQLVIVSGTFSATPECWGNRLTSDAADTSSVPSGTANSATSVRMMVNNGAGSPLDPAAINVYCVGPR